MSFLKLGTRSSAFMLPPSVAVYGANDMAPWGHMYVNPGLTEPLIIIVYRMIIKSPSQKNHPYKTRPWPNGQGLTNFYSVLMTG